MRTIVKVTMITVLCAIAGAALFSLASTFEPAGAGMIPAGFLTFITGISAGLIGLLIALASFALLAGADAAARIRTQNADILGMATVQPDRSLLRPIAYLAHGRDRLLRQAPSSDSRGAERLLRPSGLADGLLDSDGVISPSRSTRASL